MVFRTTSPAYSGPLPRGPAIAALWGGESTNPSGLDRVMFALVWVFVFSVPFEKMVMFDVFGSISRLIGMILMPIGILGIVSRGWVRRLTVTHWCMAAYVTWGCLTFLWTLSPDLTYDRAFTEVQLLLIVLLIWQFCPVEKGALWLTEAYVCGTLVSCVGTMYRFASRQDTYYHRYAAAGFDPNDLSLGLALSLPLSYALFLRSRGWAGSGWLLQIGAAALTCLLTASRMGAVVTVLALTVVPATASYLNGRRRTALAVAIIAIVIACVSVVPVTSWERLSTIATEVHRGTLDVRTVIWASAIEAFTQRPLAGLGAGAFQEVVPPLMSYYDDQNAYVAHNSYLSVLTERGILGFLLFSMLMGSIIATAWKIKPRPTRNAWLITFAVWAVGAATLTYEHRKATWIMFALIIQSVSWPATTRPERNHRDWATRLLYRTSR